jgi:ankyrin repeat protein
MVDRESKEYAFRVAIDSGDIGAARKLLSEMPDLPIRLSAERVWLLKDAAKKSSPEMIRWLVQEVGEDVARQDANEYTALHFAVIFGKFENAQALLELGADANLGEPLFSVPSSDLDDPVAMAALLIAHGADVNQLVVEEGMPARNILSEAVDYDDSDMIEFLRSKGAKLPEELSAS